MTVIGELLGLTPPPWVEDARCAEVGGDWWFPDKGGSTREAKLVCLECPVRAACLKYALDRDERYGIWGGYSERERRRLKRGEIFEPSWVGGPARHREEPQRCRCCGDRFEGHGAAVYCSPECRREAYRRKLAGKRTVICRRCGAEFVGDRRTRHCSDKCRAEAKRLNKQSQRRAA